tara:strand:- start:1392 stop:1943 length:552 start_codon:yes stop_codon:yes gene_type:complete
MARLADRKQFLLSEATRMINDDNASGRDTLINAYLAEMRQIDKEAARSPLMRAYSEADWLDKAVVFFTGSRRDVALVIVSSILAALITWLAVSGQFTGFITEILERVFGVLPAFAQNPAGVLNDREAMGSLIAALAAIVVAIAFVAFSISFFFSQNAARRKEARDFLTMIVTFFIGILTGWAL